MKFYLSLINSSISYSRFLNDPTHIIYTRTAHIYNQSYIKYTHNIALIYNLDDIHLRVKLNLPRYCQEFPALGWPELVNDFDG